MDHIKTALIPISKITGIVERSLNAGKKLLLYGTPDTTRLFSGCAAPCLLGCVNQGMHIGWAWAAISQRIDFLRRGKV